MVVQGWLIVGGNGSNLPPMPPGAYVGDTVGSLPDAANFKVGQWMLWRPVPATLAGVSTQMAVVCVQIPL